jgi:HEAT repeat protein
VTKLIRRGWVAGIAALLLTWASTAQAADDVTSRRLKELFEKGVKAVETEDYKTAEETFKTILDMGVSPEDALKLRDLVEVRLFIQALTEGTPALRKGVLGLLELAAEAEKKRLTDREQIEKLVRQLLGPFEARQAAYSGLISAGRYAVPALLRRLADTDAPPYRDYRVRATVALIRIGEEAVLPLCTALRSKQEQLRQDISFILGQIGDPRAVPYLLRAAKSDPETVVRTVAQTALDGMSEFVTVPDTEPHVALLRQARLYYQGDPSVQRPSRYGRAIWTWSDDKGLVMQIVPDFVYPASMARKVATEALLAKPDYEPVLPVLISAYHQEVLVIRRRLETPRTDPSQRLSELEERQLRARLAKSENVLVTLRSAGEKHYYRALGVQLRNKRPGLAVRIIHDLAQVASPQMNSYAFPSELMQPPQPLVLKVEFAAAARRATAPTSTARTAPGAPKTDEAAAVRKPDPMRLFAVKVEAEAERAEAPTPTETTAEAAGAQTLRELIAVASARRHAVEAAGAATRKEGTEATAAVRANALVRALQSADKDVRYNAAAAIAKIGPRADFAGSRAVVEILGQAVTETGVSTVLVISSDAQATNRLQKLLRDAGHEPYSAASAPSALASARSLPPKDLIALDANMGDVYASLKKDPAVAGIPVLVFAKAEDTSAVRKDFPGAAAVVSLKQEPDEIRAEVDRVMLRPGVKTGGEGVAAGYARLGAQALATIPHSGSPLSAHLPKIKPALTQALDSKDPAVRISAIRALGKANVRALVPRLADMCSDEARSEAERRACLQALGDMFGPSDPTPPEVVTLLVRIHKTGSGELRRFAAKALAGAALPPTQLEDLINAQEAADVEPAAAPAGAGQKRPTVEELGEF